MKKGDKVGPKRLQGDFQCYAGSGSLLQRPRCAAFIGAIVAEWSMAESMLSTHYMQLLFGPTLSGVPVGQGAWIAMETFDTISSFSQRVTMLRVAAKRRNAFTPDEIKAYATALKRLQDAGDDRIIAAHGRWSLCDKLPDAVVWMKHAGSNDNAWIYDESILTALLQRIAQRSLELQMLFFNVFTPKLKVAAEALIGHIVAAHERKNTIQGVLGDPDRHDA